MISFLFYLFGTIKKFAHYEKQLPQVEIQTVIKGQGFESRNAYINFLAAGQKPSPTFSNKTWWSVFDWFAQPSLIAGVDLVTWGEQGCFPETMYPYQKTKGRGVVYIWYVNITCLVTVYSCN